MTRQCRDGRECRLAPMIYGIRTSCLSFGLALTLAVGCGVVPVTVVAQETANEAQNADTLTVFDLPVIRRTQVQIGALLQASRFEDADRLISQLLERYPNVADNLYVAAMIATLRQRPEEALDYLEKAAEEGFRDADRLAQEQVFASYREGARFRSIVETVRTNAESYERPDLGNTGKPAPVRGQVARVTSENTVWDPSFNLLQSRFTFSSSKFAAKTADAATDMAADRLNDLVLAGKGAGNNGDLYDNRDRGHSFIRKEKFPQLTFVEYAPEAKAGNLDFGVNLQMFFNAPVIGNASLGRSGHSIMREVLANQAALSVLYLQYRSNLLYVYPAVRDYAPLGKVDGIPANTPYIILSQGKSYSDKPFLHAVANILAALKPSVKAHLIETKTLMPIVQMILRRGMMGINADADYLSAKAHPTAFDAERIDRLRMIDHANSLTVETLPPTVHLTVIEENEVTVSRGDETKTFEGEVFTTPGAIARLGPTAPGQAKALVVSAAKTTEGTAEDVSYEWVVLEGDPNTIRIEKRNDSGSVASIEIPYHERRPSRATPGVMTDRVDIGVFARRGDEISAPAFVSVYFPTDRN